MGNGNLSQATRSKVAEDGMRSSQLPAPVTESIIKNPVCGRILMKVLWESNLSGKVMDFIIILSEVLSKNGHILLLKQDGTLQVCRSWGNNKKIGELGILDPDLRAVKKMEVDLGMLGVPENRLGELSIPAFELFFRGSRFPSEVRERLFSYEDILVLDRANKVIFSMNPEMELKKIFFMEGKSTLLYLDVKGLQEIPVYSRLHLSYGEILA